MYALTHTFRSPALTVLRDLNRLIDYSGVRTRPSASVLPLQVVEQDDSYLVSLEVPGARKEELKVTLDEDLVTVTFTKEQPAGTADNPGRVVYADRISALARRTFRLPEDTAQTGHEARLENGVLVLKFVKEPQREPAIKELTIQ